MRSRHEREQADPQVAGSPAGSPDHRRCATAIRRSICRTWRWPCCSSRTASCSASCCVSAPGRGSFSSQQRTELDKAPRVSGGGADPRLARGLSAALAAAEGEAAGLKDEFVSVEHLALALIGDGAGTGTARAFAAAGVTRDRFLQALAAVRGNQRVTSEDPEARYEALEKYARRRRRRGARRQARSRHRPRRRDPAGHPHPLPARPRTTRCSSASPASARRPSSRGWRSASSAATSPSG